jgi:chorismate synthase
MSSTLGRLLRVTTFGESHGPAVGAVVDGCPPGVPLASGEIQAFLDLRRPDQPAGSGRRESDRVEILSGVLDGATLGSPIALLIRNEDADPAAYEALRDVYRPSHADFSTEARYGVRDWRGGGRASGRETVARVAAGAVARAVLAHLGGGEVVAWTAAVGGVQARVDADRVQRAAVYADVLRCPDGDSSEQMAGQLDQARAAGDSLGGVVECVVREPTAGLGEPVFGKLDAELGGALLSIPACKAVEIGAGFAAAAGRGSEFNDPFVSDGERIVTTTNHSGGIQGGITNGMPILLRAAFKPVPTLGRPQQTVDRQGAPATVDPGGRHDVCVAPRAVPVVEAMVALVIADQLLRLRGQVG